MTSLVLALVNYFKEKNIVIDGNSVKVSASFPIEKSEIPCIAISPGEATYKEISLKADSVLVKEKADVNVYAKSQKSRDCLTEQVENALINPSALENEGFVFMHIIFKRTLDLPEYGIFRTVFVVEAFRYVLK